MCGSGWVHARACAFVSSYLPSRSVAPTDFKSLQDFLSRMSFPVHYNLYHLPSFLEPLLFMLPGGHPGPPVISLLNQPLDQPVAPEPKVNANATHPG